MKDYDHVEVLLVEDNVHDAELAMRALKKNNLLNKLYWVRDGAEALDFVLRRDAYADRDGSGTLKLILLDLKMPKVDGFDVLRQLKGDEETKAIPIVVMTSSNQEKDVATSYRLGANGFVVKPVEFSDFIEAVSKLEMYWLFVNRVPAP